MNNHCIVVLTALSVESDAVIEQLSNVTVESIPNVGTNFRCGNFLGSFGKFRVVVGQTNQTNTNAALETERALEFFKPSHAFFVGVAGGLKDVKVGDIVIGERVIGYERGKSEDNGFQARPQFGSSSYDLERLATLFSSGNVWEEISKSLVNSQFGKDISVLSGTIASGEKVDASLNSDLHKHIKNIAGNALAVEMEGLGFLEVCRTRPSVKCLLLRGISDLVDDKGEMDSNGSQSYASKNVSAFLFGLINELNIADSSNTVSKTEILLEITCKLYPRGLEDRNVWERSGGDLSLVKLNDFGKGQWFNALKLLKQGGGGSEITVESLVEIISVDFPGNKDLNMLN